MKKYVVRNLIQAGTVVIEGDIKDITNLIFRLLSHYKKYELNQKEFHTLDRDKKKNKTLLKNYQHYILPDTVKFNESKNLNTSRVDWRYLDQVVVEEVSPQNIFEDLQFDKINVDLSKVYCIDQRLVSTKNESSVDKIKEVLCKAFEKYILDEELYDNRLELWRKNYVEAEAKGEVALKAFNQSNPRPSKGNIYVSEVTYAVSQKPVELQDFFNLKKDYHERFFGNPYMMIDMPMMRRSRLMVNEEIQLEQNPDNSNNSIIRDLKNLRIESLRNNTKKDNLNIVPFKDKMEKAIADLQKRWETNLEDVKPANNVA